MIRWFRQYRDVLVTVLLVVAPLSLFLARGGKPRDVNLVDRALLGLASPVESALSSVLRGGFEGVGTVAGLWSAREREEVCLARLEGAAQLEATLQEVQAENQRLKALVSALRPQGPREVLARVVGLNPGVRFHSVRLDQGERQGVLSGMPVVTGAGVVGQVVRAVEGSADVMLVSDPASRVAVAVQRTRVRGTVTGQGPRAPLALDFVRRDDDVQRGDRLVTSGTDGVYPPGLLVGTVGEVTRGEVAMFLSAPVEPSAALETLEEVLVIPTLLTPAPEARR